MDFSRTPLAIFCITLLWLIGCGNNEQKIAQEKAMNSARDTLKSLRKLEAAAQVGVNKMQYGPMLIEAKASLNETNRLLSDDKLKQELNAAMQVYQDASTVWNVDGFMDIAREPGRTIQVRYDLPRYDKKPESMFYNKIYTSDAVGLIWPAAKPHLDEAAKILEK